MGLISQIQKEAADREAGRSTPETRSEDIYRLLKEYRTVPDMPYGVSAGILTPRETWLYDRLVKIVEEGR